MDGAQAKDRRGRPATIRLNPMDNVMPRMFANFLFCLSLKPGESFEAVHDILLKSLEKTCDEVPVLKCRIFTVPISDENPTAGQLEARPCGERWSPELVYNDMSSAWPDYDDLLDSGLPQSFLEGHQVLPKSEFAWELIKTGAPSIVCQANYVKSGLILAVGIFHSVIDGMSGSLLLKLWAGNARALTNARNSGPMLAMHPDSCNYSLLEQIWLAEKARTPLESDTTSHSSWRLLGALPPGAPADQVTSGPIQPEMDSKIFYVSAAALEKIVGDCVSEDASFRVTANDALMALLWRCIIRARATVAGPSSDDYAPDAETLLDTTLDGRALIGNPLPWSYMGTLIYIATTSMTVGRLIGESTSLREVAVRMRQAVSTIDRKRALEAFGLAAGVQDYGSLRFPFATLQGAEVCITSWLTISAFDISFGDAFFSNGGRPDHVRVPKLEFGALCRRCVVLPMQASGGCEILVELLKDEMAILEEDKEFAEYARVV